MEQHSHRLMHQPCDSPLLADQWRQEAGGVIFVTALQAALLTALLAAAWDERQR